MEMSAERLMVDAFIEWDVAQATLKGENKSGDGYLVKPFAKNVLVAVVDGLGHGDEAAAAAKIAVDVLDANAHDSVISLFKRSHEALRKSRGVVMSMALLNGLDATLTWTGVGNVEGLVVRADPEIKPEKESLLMRPGVLGSSLPTLYASIIQMMPGDTFVFATDGIRSGFDEIVNSYDPPKEIATSILANYAKESDDALVLVARYLGQRL
jgi:negative regulator of sigma-B (phosphoserine phosphatase)